MNAIAQRLGDLGTNHVWFSGVGHPAGCDWKIEEDGDQLELPEGWWDLEGTVEGNKWTWDGKGSPRDFKGNTVQQIVAFIPAA